MENKENQDFLDEAKQLAKHMDAGSSEHVKAYQALKKKYFPKLFKAEQELVTFEEKHPLLIQGPKPSEKQQEAMQKEFSEYFKKHKHVHAMEHELLNNPEYQHEAQLIAEKFDNQQDSAEYLKAIHTLKEKYHPEIRQSREELEMIIQKCLQ